MAEGRVGSSSIRLCSIRFEGGKRGLKYSSNAASCSFALCTCGKSFRSRSNLPDRVSGTGEVVEEARIL